LFEDMRNYFSLSLFFVALALVGAGCVLSLSKDADTTKFKEVADSTQIQSQKNAEQDSQAAQAVKAEGPATVIEGADAGDWLAYQNEEYGFEFKYPGEWIVHTGSVGPKNDEYGGVFFDISDYERAVEHTDNSFLDGNSKEMLRSLKEAYEQASDKHLADMDTIKDIDELLGLIDKTTSYANVIVSGIRAHIGIGYEVPSGSYFMRVSFFMEKNYITLTYVFSEDYTVDPWPGVKPLVEQTKNDLYNGNMKNVTRKEMNLLFNIAKTIKGI